MAAVQKPQRLLWLACGVVVLIAAGSSAQTCNSKDPESGGLIFPAFASGGAEKGDDGLYPDTDPQGMAVLYLLLLLYMFLGVSIVADVFMGAIETITSRTVIKEVKDDDGKIEQLELKVWNPTVANLTLMALGSSAPEILLSIIEITGNDFFSGPLGPSTIIGSAAFNLFCISAVCVVSIPAGEVRKIEELGVFFITASFSVFSYLWLYIILVANTKDIVDIWEGVVTFLLFPVLVTLAYLADRGYFKNLIPRRGTAIVPVEQIVSVHREGGEVYEFKPHEVAKLLRGTQKHELEAEVAAKVAMAKAQREQKHSRMWYRINATRQLAGQKKLLVDMPVLEGMHQRENNTLGFVCTTMRVPEAIGSFTVEVVRQGNLNSDVSVKYRTVQDTATEGKDYEKAEGTIKFPKGEATASFMLTIIDDNEQEDDEQFHVDLFGVEGDGWTLQHERLTVTILDDDKPGQLQFKQTVEGELAAEYVVAEDCGFAEVEVERVGGSHGEIKCQFRTRDGAAKSGKDYDDTSGELVFKDGELSHFVRVAIHDDDGYEFKEDFLVELLSPQGCELAGITKAKVWITDNDRVKNVVEKASALLRLNLDAYRIGSSSWKQQFDNALAAPEDDAGAFGRTMHYLSMPWMVLFAIIPPTHIGHGWPCFLAALAMIGLVTAIIGDFASLLGCSMGIKDEVTAITFVALGTSLPDTFASKTAAVMDPSADASIGNITGSNSVNVLLGLGLPWLIASLYWESAGTTSAWKEEYPDLYADGKTGFAVPAGDLGFSVIIFTVLSIVCLCVLVARRHFFGAELGGKMAGLTALLLVALWFLYLIFSILKTYGKCC